MLETANSGAALEQAAIEIIRVRDEIAPSAAEARTAGRESTSSSAELGVGNEGKRLQREPLLEREKGLSSDQLDIELRGFGQHG